MSLAVSAWPGNSGTFFRSVGKDKSGRFSPLWMSGRDTTSQGHHTGDKEHDCNERTKMNRPRKSCFGDYSPGANPFPRRIYTQQ